MCLWWCEWYIELNSQDSLTVTYDLKIQRYHKWHTNIRVSKVHNLRCMGYKLWVKFQSFKQTFEPIYTWRYVFYKALKFNKAWYLKIMTSHVLVRLIPDWQISCQIMIMYRCTECNTFLPIATSSWWARNKKSMLWWMWRCGRLHNMRGMMIHEKFIHNFCCVLSKCAKKSITKPLLMISLPLALPSH